MRKLLSVTMFFVCIFSSAVFSGNSDYVELVYSCGNDVGIKMKNAGFVVVRESDIGEKRVERIMSIALALVATQNQTGYFNEQSKTTVRWCGIDDVKPITVLAIRKNK